MNNEEIKEILEKPNVYSFNDECYLYFGDYNKLKDYITNLQQENENQKELIRKQSKRNSRQRLANTKQQDLILKLQQEKERLKERVAYLERSNNRREDTIIGLRFEVAEQEDYKSCCEKASEKLSFIDEALENDTLNVPLCIAKINSALNILQNGSDSQ